MNICNRINSKLYNIYKQYYHIINNVKKYSLFFSLYLLYNEIFNI